MMQWHGLNPCPSSMGPNPKNLSPTQTNVVKSHPNGCSKRSLWTRLNLFLPKKRSNPIGLLKLRTLTKDSLPNLKKLPHLHQPLTKRACRFGTSVKKKDRKNKLKSKKLSAEIRLSG